MSRTDSNVDVAIIGAGPAGASAAIALARAHRSVVLIEKHQFPRDKVCGGCISGPAVASWKALLGRDCILPGVAGSRITLVIGSYRVTCRPRGLTWMASRAALDASLAEAASAAGADVRYGKPARVDRPGSSGEVVVGDERIRADTILIASGLSGIPAAMGLGGHRFPQAMIAQQWVQPADSCLPRLGEVELHWLRGGYVGLATPETNRCVIAMAARAKMVAGQNVFQGLRRLNPRASVWKMLPSDAPQRFGAKGTAGFPWMPDRLGDSNVLLIGDAAGYAEPFAGAGIGQAIYSAGCAARAILEGGNVQEKYTALMRPHRRVLERTRVLSSSLNMATRCFPSFEGLPVVDRLISHWVERIHVRGAL